MKMLHECRATRVSWAICDIEFHSGINFYLTREKVKARLNLKILKCLTKTCLCYRVLSQEYKKQLFSRETIRYPQKFVSKVKSSPLLFLTITWPKKDIAFKFCRCVVLCMFITYIPYF